MKYAEQSEGHEYSVAYTYNDKNQLAAVMEIVDGHDRESTYEYDEDGRITFFEKVLARRRYNYDAFGRVSSTQTLGRDYAEIFKTTYGYNDTDTTVSGQVSSLTHDGPQYDKTYSYTYDDNGNILSVTEIIPRTQFDNLEDLLPDIEEDLGITLPTSVEYPVSYVYDSANQLIRENNRAGGFTHTWTYDDAGNILERKEYAYTTGSLEGVTPTDTVTYGYGDSQWGDLLTAYDGNAITYDQIGNPLTDGTWTYTWQHGRQLASMTDGTTTWDYTYDANGLRTNRTDGTTNYRYVYDGGQLTFMARNGLLLRFAYTPEGTPLSILYKGTTYYYVTNLQGDVTAILSQNGYVMVEYAYDAWGNLLSTTGPLANSLGLYNPLRYRGYVYDQETGLYYLQSRYYNPRVGRFINADGLISTSQGVLGNNLFAYCGGDPINRVDAAGRKWLKNLWNDFWQGIKGWLGDEKEKAKTNDNITTTSGVTASGAFGGGASASLGATSDTKGNVGISFTINGGGGFPSAGVGVFVSGNNAPTIFEQSGLGTTVGASGGPWIVSVGGDYNMLINQDANRTYHGGTFSASLGFYPTVVEVHGEVGYTWVWGFNVYDVAIDIADFMLMEE